MLLCMYCCVLLFVYVSLVVSSRVHVRMEAGARLETASTRADRTENRDEIYSAGDFPNSHPYFSTIYMTTTKFGYSYGDMFAFTMPTHKKLMPCF